MQLTAEMREEIDSRVRHCDDEKCGKMFIMRVDAQRFCSPRCSSRAHARQRARRRREEQSAGKENNNA